MARGEDEPQQIVADGIVERRIEIGRRILLELELVAERVMLAFGEVVPPEAVDGAMLGGGGEPCAGIVGDAAAGPLLERGDERVLRCLLYTSPSPRD